MKKNRKPVAALLFGGKGYEHEVSLRGAEFALPLIDRDLYAPLPVYISKQGEWLIPKDKNEIPKADDMAKEKIPMMPISLVHKNGCGGFLSEGGFCEISAAIPLLHGDFGEDGIIQGALECAGIPYVGCKVCAGSLAIDKVYTKIIAEHLGIPTAKWVLGIGLSDIDRARHCAEARFGYPMFIKPARLGSSVGASPVLSAKDFDKAYAEAADIGGGRVLIEERISIKRELECAYFSTKSKRIFTNIGEIVCNDGFYDYENKYEKDCGTVISANSDISEELSEKIKEYSKKLSEFLGLIHLSRIDFFECENTVLFNEINTFPGFTEGSLYPKLLEAYGIPPRELINFLIRDCVEGGA